MKKRFLGVALSLAMLLTFIPFAPAAQAATFEATLMGQLDTDVSDSIGEWAFGDLPDATVVFELGKPAKIIMDFKEPIKFTGNWTGISTNVPVNGNDDAELTGGVILSFMVDGQDFGHKQVPVIDRDENGFLTIDIARQWGGSYDAYDLADMDPFSHLEIEFVVGFSATLMGQLDTGVSDSIGEWDFGDLPDATAAFKVGREATISMKFDEPIKFTGNWTGISTFIPVDSDEAAEATGAIITSFIVDGNELGSKEVPLINRDGSGFMTIDIARQWGGDYDAYDLAGMDPFSELEITFIVPNLPDGTAGGADDGPVDFAKEGHAWIGGTFITDEGEFDWIEYEDQKVAFKLGEPFTVVLDFGSATQTHGEAGWGYISVVQTDIQDGHLNYDVYINDIRVDGHSISFEPDNVSVGFDRGVRFGLTDGWADNPVVSGPPAIGEFSKLEVEVVFVAAGDPNPFGADSGVIDEPAVTPPPPIERPPAEEPESEGMQWWVWLIIGGAVVAVVAVVVIVVKKKA